MSDILEGLGSATEGGLLARALEPDSGARSPHPEQPDHCLNCGSELHGAFCSACGQKGLVHRTIGGFMHDLLHGALHFEGKFWHTLPLLAFRPGALTRRYIEGQRARFVSPLALFLFGVFLMFAVFQMFGFTAPTSITSAESVEAGIEEARHNAAAEMEALRERLANEEMTDEQRTRLQEELDLLESLVGANPDTVQTGVARGDQGRVAVGRAEDAERAPEPAPGSGTEDRSGVVRADLSDFVDGESGIAWLDGVVGKWRENPGLMLYKLQANAYKFSWLLIPISIPFVWLLFAWKRRFRGYDHAIFVTYSLSFMTLLFILVSILARVGVGSGLLTAAVLIIPPVHLYKQLRHAYSLSRFSALWRLVALFVFIAVILVLFLNLLLLLGLTG